VLPSSDAAARSGAVPGAGTTAGVGSGTVPTVQVRPAALDAPAANLDLDLFPPFVVAGLGVLLLGQLLRIRGVRQS
jgi:hypothetical protein